MACGRKKNDLWICFDDQKKRRREKATFTNLLTMYKKRFADYLVQERKFHYGYENSFFSRFIPNLPEKCK
jgi:hypothetical protein